MDDAKKRHRPRLKNWSRDGFATTRAHEFEALAPKFTSGDAGAPAPGHAEYLDIPHVHAHHITRDEFISKYEETNTPLLISGIPQVEDWPAVRRWRLGRLCDDFRDCRFKCGEDDDGHSIKITLKTFSKYLKYQTDDSPLYIFDSAYDDHSVGKQLLQDYKVLPTPPSSEQSTLQTPADQSIQSIQGPQPRVH